MKSLTLLSLWLMAFSALAQTTPTNPTLLNPQIQGDEQAPMPLGEEPTDRTPAQEPVPGRPINDDALKVLPELPEAQIKRDARTIQNEVYKSLYNQEMKQDQREDVLDE